MLNIPLGGVSKAWLCWPAWRCPQCCRSPQTGASLAMAFVWLGRCLLVTPSALAAFVRADDVSVTVEFFNLLFTLSLFLVAPASFCSNSKSSSGTRLLRIQQDAVFGFFVWGFFVSGRCLWTKGNGWSSIQLINISVCYETLLWKKKSNLKPVLKVLKVIVELCMDGGYTYVL